MSAILITAAHMTRLATHPGSPVEHHGGYAWLTRRGVTFRTILQRGAPVSYTHLTLPTKRIM